MVRENKISVVRTDDTTIEKDDIVTVYYADNYMMITKNHNNADVGYKKISDRQYLNTRTGEIKFVDKKMSDTRSVESLRNTYFDLSQLISLNFDGDSSECFITLTYNRKVTEDSVTKDIKNFWGRFCRFVDDYKLYKAIFVIEYQGLQANYNPHIHMLLKRRDGQKITLSEADVCSLWRSGYTDIRPIFDVDGLINYLSPFRNKRKMSRLGCYSSYKKIFRCRGKIDRPKRIKLPYSDAKKLAEKNNLQAYKHESYVVLDGNNLEVNRIQKINYKETQNYE